MRAREQTRATARADAICRRPYAVAPPVQSDDGASASHKLLR
jgi:hypothetical protein